eukprot:134264-Chlamydomonas_euryale.AAC.4
MHVGEGGHAAPRSLLDQEFFSGTASKCTRNNLHLRHDALPQTAHTSEARTRLRPLLSTRLRPLTHVSNLHILSTRASRTHCPQPCVLQPPPLPYAVFTRQVDVWSTGMMLHWLYTGRLPIWPNGDPKSGRTVEQMTELLADADFSLTGPQWRSMSAEGLSFLRALLTHDEGDRLGVADALAHPWLARHAGPWAERHAADLATYGTAAPVRVL